MTHTADLYWSFRSPWCYLGTKRYRQLDVDYDLSVNLRFVLPLAVRQPDYFTKRTPAAGDYFLTDLVRTAEYLDIPIGYPDPDPIVMDMQTLEIAEEQPYIFWLTHLGQEANRRGKGLPFIDDVSTMIFSGTVKGWDKGDHLKEVAARCGLDLDDMKAIIAGNEASYDQELTDNADALDAAGHWGVPTLVFEGEPFFGQDRIDLAIWRMTQKGVKKR